MRALAEAASARGATVVAWSGGARIAFAFEVEDGGVEGAMARVLGLLSADTARDASAFAAGLALGELVPLLGTEAPGTSLSGDMGVRVALAAGDVLAVATGLSREARPGEIVCAKELHREHGMRLAVRGRVRARARRHDGVVEVARGVRIRAAEPWRLDVANGLSRLRVPPLLGVRAEDVPLSPSALTVVRADPGAGGSRLLAEVAARAPRALVVAPVGASLAPMGALRRAVERSITRDLGAKLVALAEPLDALLSGEPVDVDTVATLVTAYFATKSGRHDSMLPPRDVEGGTAGPARVPSVVVVDDVLDVDPASLEAVTRAVARAGLEGHPVSLVVRLGKTDAVPSAFGAVPRAGEVALGPLSSADALAVASACASGGLDDASSAMWSARAGHLPLAIVEALTCAVATGAISWDAPASDVARPKRSSRPPARPAESWITDRLALLDAPSRVVAAIVAMLGGEAKQAFVARVLEGAALDVDLEAAIEGLVREKWLLDVQEDWVGLPSRTHVRVLVEAPSDEERRRLHAAIGAVLRADEGAFGRADAAFHAAGEGDPRRAARIALDAARAAASRGLEASTFQLATLAGEWDESLAEGAREVLASVRSPSGTASAKSSVARGSASEKLLAAVPMHDAAPPFTPRELPPSLAPPASTRGSEVADELGELARDAIQDGSAGLDRWLEAVTAKGETTLPSERMRAVARASRGEIGDALRVLRRMREGLDPADHALRCQTSLALGISLSAGGRPAEALLEGLDALARARAGGDARGTRACLAFLAKLYASVGRADDAARLSSAG